MIDGLILIVTQNMKKRVGGNNYCHKKYDEKKSAVRTTTMKMKTANN